MNKSIPVRVHRSIFAASYRFLFFHFIFFASLSFPLQGTILLLHKEDILTKWSILGRLKVGNTTPQVRSTRFRGCWAAILARCPCPPRPHGCLLWNRCSPCIATSCGIPFSDIRANPRHGRVATAPRWFSNWLGTFSASFAMPFGPIVRPLHVLRLSCWLLRQAKRRFVRPKSLLHRKYVYFYRRNSKKIHQMITWKRMNILLFSLTE